MWKFLGFWKFCSSSNPLLVTTRIIFLKNKFLWCSSSTHILMCSVSYQKSFILAAYGEKFYLIFWSPNVTAKISSLHFLKMLHFFLLTHFVWFSSIHGWKVSWKIYIYFFKIVFSDVLLEERGRKTQIFTYKLFITILRMCELLKHQLCKGEDLKWG